MAIGLQNSVALFHVGFHGRRILKLVQILAHLAEHQIPRAMLWLGHGGHEYAGAFRRSIFQSNLIIATLNDDILLSRVRCHHQVHHLVVAV